MSAGERQEQAEQERLEQKEVAKSAGERGWIILVKVGEVSGVVTWEQHGDSVCGDSVGQDCV